MSGTTPSAGSEAAQETLPPLDTTDIVVPGPEVPQTPEQTSEPAAEAKAPETQEPQEAKEDAEPKRNRVPANVRIAQLTGRAKVAEARLQDAMSEIQALKARLQPPKDLDAMSYDERESLRLNQALDRRQAEQAEQVAERAQREIFEARQEMFFEKLKSAGDAIPQDFNERFAKVEISPTLADLIVESDQSPLLALHLANNPALASELSRAFDGEGSTRKTAAAAAKELARIEASLKPAPAKRATQAPNPGTVLNGGQPPPARTLDEIDDMEEYSRRRKEAWKSGKS